MTCEFNENTQLWRVRKLVWYVNKIHDPMTRDFVLYCLFFAPRSYWEAPSSPSGKHHPLDECCDGGQLLHVLRVCQYAEILMRINSDNYPESDIIYASCITHDIGKFGLIDDLPYKTTTEHPNLAVVYLNSIRQCYPMKTIPFKEVLDCVACHMGRWGRNPPLSQSAKIVHMADCIAATYKEEV